MTFILFSNDPRTQSAEREGCEYSSDENSDAEGHLDSEDSDEKFDG